MRAGMRGTDMHDLADRSGRSCTALASLAIGGTLERKAPGADVDQLIDRATRRFFGVSQPAPMGRLAIST
jgi:hypothetical protein